MKSCERPPAEADRHCSDHLLLRYRYGDPLIDPSIVARTFENARGYLGIINTGHPIAGRAGSLPVHRMVLYDAIGPGDHPCHWCGKTVTWDIAPPAKGSLTADHLDGDNQHNEASNLVPACGRCNAHRPPSTYRK